MLIRFKQIEKFVETLFPSQTAEEAKLKLSGQSTEDEAKKKQQEKESWEDMKMMMIIMGSIIAVITIILVRDYILALANSSLTLLVWSGLVLGGAL